ncbi:MULTISPECIES: histidine phosphatase family protein [unclassified Thermoactinomyces]|jgi:alpha-ribazole phosphatase|uniref:histidine phosphatase family protein n=1 Tax=unclassified Thermoactinomyces TaxID=2634588 RepID=UPI0018DDA8BD|nr:MULTISPECIES: histidine phosphatase family protein [unclassified Thermoactinomyces]MBH8597099.1 histidine phosphatase family protein [Thermoactinomyces sp. CICC 10523]MBH8606230.1 histidine phosphatase family protein [Thermoactinomyces sp. CICC 10521]
MVRLIWIRHGETEANRAKRYIGHLDEPLNGSGIEQAGRLARSLAHLDVEIMYVSDLRRCRETARFCAKHWPDAPMEITPDLRECSFGRWEGWTYREIAEREPELLQKWLGDPFRHAPPQGESLRDLDRRLTAWLEEAEQKTVGKTAAVFSHGGPIRWFLAKHVFRDWDQFWRLEIPHAGAWVAVKEERWEIERIFAGNGAEES